MARRKKTTMLAANNDFLMSSLLSNAHISALKASGTVYDIDTPFHGANDHPKALFLGRLPHHAVEPQEYLPILDPCRAAIFRSASSFLQ
jgi:hypothetical protein